MGVKRQKGLHFLKARRFWVSLVLPQPRAGRVDSPGPCSPTWLRFPCEGAADCGSGIVHLGCLEERLPSRRAAALSPADAVTAKAGGIKL